MSRVAWYVAIAADEDQSYDVTSSVTMLAITMIDVRRQGNLLELPSIIYCFTPEIQRVHKEEPQRL
jgi:hypothetical protein